MKAREFNVSLNIFKDTPFEGFGSPLPKGIYKQYSKLYDLVDDNVFTMTVFFEVKIHFGRNQF
jgi:hypothetical protein